MLHSTQHENLKCDVLIVGGGVAGMMAAYEAHMSGAHTILVTKSTFPAGSSSMARRGYAAALGHTDERDSPLKHWEDVVAGGFGINNQKLARIMTEEVIERTYLIDSWGLGLVKGNNGKYDQEFSPGEIYPRLLHCVQDMGKPLMKTLSSKIKELGIELHTHTFLVDLLQNESGSVVGAWGFKYREEKVVIISSKSTVLCTGGAPQLHRINDAPPQVTGDGYAMGLRAGAELIDMEMIDYVLTTGWPEKLAGYGSNSHIFLPAGGKFLNANEERFMKRYNPDVSDGIYEKGHRSLVNKSIGIEIFEGRGSGNGCIFFDVREAIDSVGERGEKIFRAFKNAGVDLREQPFEVCSCPHTFLGGLKIDEYGCTTKPRLYAGGESAGGVHGSNRLAGAALADSFVFGSRAGRSAAKKSKEAGLPDFQVGSEEEIRVFLEKRKYSGGGTTPLDFRLSIQKNIYENIGQVRSRERLMKGLTKLKELKLESHSVVLQCDTELNFLKSLLNVIESENLIDVATMIATSALLRTESRGGHVRIDYPNQDDEKWMANTVVYRGGQKEEINARVDSIVHLDN